MTQKTCKATNKYGQRCKNPATIFGMCVAHYYPGGSPDKAKLSRLRHIIEYYQKQMEKYQREYDKLKTEGMR